jgi:hypothetical protein
MYRKGSVFAAFCNLGGRKEHTAVFRLSHLYSDCVKGTLLFHSTGPILNILHCILVAVQYFKYKKTVLDVHNSSSKNNLIF